MWAFTAFDGSAAAVDAVIRAALDEGLLVFNAGAQPTRVRLLLPVNTTDAELERGLRAARTRAPARRRGTGGEVLILRPVAAEDLDDLARARLAARLRQPPERPRVPRRAHRASRSTPSCGRGPGARRLAPLRVHVRARGSGRAALRRHLADPRQERPARGALLLARGVERGALEPGAPEALRAPQAPPALHRGRPHRGGRPDPRPGVPRTPRRSAERRSRSCASRSSRRTPSASSAS